MKLGHDLIKKLSKTYVPTSKLTLRHKGNDVLLITDDDGHPVQLFIGKKDNHGVIKGNRYRRVLIMDKKGHIVKDHWDMKGKAS